MSKHKKKKAVALHYDQVHAPTVSAKGADAIADQIIELAKKHEIPIFENKEMLELLSEISLNKEIPQSLYLCISAVITVAYKIKGKTPAGWNSEGDEDSNG